MLYRSPKVIYLIHQENLVNDTEHVFRDEPTRMSKPWRLLQLCQVEFLHNYYSTYYTRYYSSNHQEIYDFWLFARPKPNILDKAQY